MLILQVASISTLPIRIRKEALPLLASLLTERDASGAPVAGPSPAHPLLPPQLHVELRKVAMDASTDAEHCLSSHAAAAQSSIQMLLA